MDYIDDKSTSSGALDNLPKIKAEVCRDRVIGPIEVRKACAKNE